MGVWAGGPRRSRATAHLRNYVFRVSAVDELVDKALVDYAIAKHSTKKPGMILINNPWGESNEKGLKAALEAKKIPYAGIEKFETNDVDVVPQLARPEGSGLPDVLFLVANVAPSSQVVKSLEPHGLERADRVALGTGGPAASASWRAPSASKVHFIQTYSFSGKLAPKGEAVLAALKKKYPEIKTLARRDPRPWASPTPYDALHLTAPRHRQGRLGRRPEDPRGLLRHRQLRRPDQSPSRSRSSPENQDALSEKDYIFTRFVEGEILPLTQ